MGNRRERHQLKEFCFSLHVRQRPLSEMMAEEQRLAAFSATDPAGFLPSIWVPDLYLLKKKLTNTTFVSLHEGNWGGVGFEGSLDHSLSREAEIGLGQLRQMKTTLFLCWFYIVHTKIMKPSQNCLNPMCMI